MSKVLYSKYNSMRRPEFTTITKIVENDGERFVVKQAMEECANNHLLQMRENYTRIRDIYENIRVIKAETYLDEKLQFEFIEGKSLAAELYENIKETEYEDLIARIRALMDEVLRCKKQYVVPFAMTEQFKRLFPDCVPQGGNALAIVNLDCILNNFVRSGAELYCLDYEWIFDFPIPVDFLKYRILACIYREQQPVLKEKNISLEQMAKDLGIEAAALLLYKKMEFCFQEYVHGEHVKYIYLENYKKKIDTIENMQLAIQLKEQHIQNLETKLEQIRHSLKNPLYGVKIFARRFMKK